MDHVVRQRSNFNRALIDFEVTINVVNVYNMRGVETNLMHGPCGLRFLWTPWFPPNQTGTELFCN